MNLTINDALFTVDEGATLAATATSFPATVLVDAPRATQVFYSLAIGRWLLADRQGDGRHRIVVPAPGTLRINLKPGTGRPLPPTTIPLVAVADPAPPPDPVLGPIDATAFALGVLNAIRAAPAVAASRLTLDLNEGLPAGTIDALARPALRADDALRAAAIAQAGWLSANAARGHAGPNGNAPADRARAAGFSGRVGECVAIAIETGLSAADLSRVTAELVEGLLIDAGVPDRAHRRILLDRAWSKVGVGVAMGAWPVGASRVPSAHLVLLLGAASSIEVGGTSPVPTEQVRFPLELMYHFGDPEPKPDLLGPHLASRGITFVRGWTDPLASYHTLKYQQMGLSEVLTINWAERSSADLVAEFRANREAVFRRIGEPAGIQFGNETAQMGDHYTPRSMQGAAGLRRIRDEFLVPLRDRYGPDRMWSPSYFIHFKPEGLQAYADAGLLDDDLVRTIDVHWYPYANTTPAQMRAIWTTAESFRSSRQRFGSTEFNVNHANVDRDVAYIATHLPTQLDVMLEHVSGPACYSFYGRFARKTKKRYPALLDTDGTPIAASDPIWQLLDARRAKRTG